MARAYYGADLAFIHDAGFGGFGRAAAPWLAARLLRRARLPDVALPSCDAVVAVGEVLNYMGRPADLGALFGRVFRALRPGGLFVFDVKLRGRAAAPVTRGRTAKDWAVLATTAEDGRGRATREIVSFRRAGRRWRRAAATGAFACPKDTP